MFANDLLRIVEIDQTKMEQNWQIRSPIEVSAIRAHQSAQKHNRYATSTQMIQMLIVIVMQIVVMVAINRGLLMIAVVVVLIVVMPDMIQQNIQWANVRLVIRWYWERSCFNQ
jgi:hypothetical protein